MDIGHFGSAEREFFHKRVESGACWSRTILLTLHAGFCHLNQTMMSLVECLKPVLLLL